MESLTRDAIYELLHHKLTPFVYGHAGTDEGVKVEWDGLLWAIAKELTEHHIRASQRMETGT